MKRSISTLLGLTFCMLLSAYLPGCARQSSPIEICDGARREPALQAFHLGEHRFTEFSCSRKSREFFQRGLALAYGFNYDAAEQEFRNLLEKDPTCAMAWWGIALVSGPHINFPLVPPEKARVAWEAITQAQRYANSGSPLERALIAALSTRYVEEQPADRSKLDEAYAAAMAAVYSQYSSNSDVGALYAEALMDLHPWDLWKADGSPQPWTPRIIEVLEETLRIDPKHPHANHLYIHAVEASPSPERAKDAADRLRTLMPGSGHLVHMPAHIYARLGLWDDASRSNVDAIAADKLFRSLYPKSGFYALYMAHSVHFLGFSKMMQGESQAALDAARTLVQEIPDDFLTEFGPIADGFLIFPSKVLMRFGRWNEILKEPAPHGGYPLSTALWHFTRSVASTALGKREAAQADHKKFRAAVKKIPANSTFGNNSSRDIAAIADLMLDGEMAAQRGQLKKAIKLLRKAAKKEDQLRYDEPPDWIQPIRHTLGIVLLRDKQYAEAEKVYREDLARFPNNGWSLYGLSRALRLQNKNAEALTVLQQFQAAWENADVSVDSSCLCQKGV